MPKQMNSMESLIGKILDECPPANEGKSDEHGFKMYYIETYNYGYTVVAKQVASGIMKGKWLIKSVETVNV